MDVYRILKKKEIIFDIFVPINLYIRVLNFYVGKTIQITLNPMVFLKAINLGRKIRILSFLCKYLPVDL